MIDPKQSAMLDQARAMLTEHFPGMWRELYCKLIAEGFAEPQAFELLKTYIIATCSVPAQK